MLERLREWKAGVCNRASAFHQSLAFHLQDPSFVVLFLLLCYLEIVLGTWSLTESGSSDTITRTRNAFLCLQALELVLQLITFHVRFFSHWGYAFDTILIATRFLNKNGITSVDEQQLILLSFLRVWRFVQVVAAYVDIEASKHHRTSLSADAWRTELEREKKQNQEEVATLREALRLAALDVAAAAINGQNDPTQSGRVSPTDSAEAESKGQGGSSPPSDTLAEGSSTGGIAME